jgi:glycosyltransferase involved in cell wall biosynthesis
MTHTNYDWTDILQGQQLDIVCLSDAPWDWILWTNRQYALSTLAQIYDKVRVLYVEPPGFMIRRRVCTPETWPSGAAVLNRRSSLPYCSEVQNRVWVVHPPLPVPSRVIRKSAFALLQWETLLVTRAALRHLHFGPPLMWTYTPYAGWYVGRLGEYFRLYECLNEHKVSLHYVWDAKRISALEEHMMRTSDIVFTVSPSLQERKAPFNHDTFMVGNPCNYELFAKAQLRSGRFPPELGDYRGPRLGFYGALSNHKIDMELLYWLAITHPEWNLVMIGTRNDGDWDRLEILPNVLILPAMAQQRLIDYVKWFDVLLIPYRSNAYIQDSTEPLKMNEYFATGIPIVSTNVPGHRVHRDVIYLAEDYESFASCIGEALMDSDEGKRQRRITTARERTWVNKVREMLTLMIQCGLLEKLEVNRQ